MENNIKEIYPEKEIKTIIEFLTSEKDIDSIDESGSVSTINVGSTLLLNSHLDRYLQNGMYVKIGNINYKVSNVVKDTSFDIAATGLSEAKWALAFEYRFGSRIEVNELLDLAQQDPSKQLARFPLLWLIIDADNSRNFNFASELLFERNLKFSMINLTNSEYTAEQRLDNNFIPTIQPYVSLFIDAIRSSKFAYMFNFENNEIIDYNDNYRYFYGSADQSVMVFDSPTDAIEFTFTGRFRNQYEC